MKIKLLIISQILIAHTCFGDIPQFRNALIEWDRDQGNPLTQQALIDSYDTLQNQRQKTSAEGIIHAANLGKPQDFIQNLRNNLAAAAVAPRVAVPVAPAPAPVVPAPPAVVPAPPDARAKATGVAGKVPPPPPALAIPEAELLPPSGAASVGVAPSAPVMPAAQEWEKDFGLETPAVSAAPAPAIPIAKVGPLPLPVAAPRPPAPISKPLGSEITEQEAAREQELAKLEAENRVAQQKLQQAQERVKNKAELARLQQEAAALQTEQQKLADAKAAREREEKAAALKAQQERDVQQQAAAQQMSAQATAAEEAFAQREQRARERRAKTEALLAQPESPLQPTESQLRESIKQAEQRLQKQKAFEVPEAPAIPSQHSVMPSVQAAPPPPVEIVTAPSPADVALRQRDKQLRDDQQAAEKRRLALFQKDQELKAQVTAEEKRREKEAQRAREATELQKRQEMEQRVKAQKQATAVSAPAASSTEISQKLIIEAEQGNLIPVQELLKQGADVNAQEKDGHTALMLAAEKGNLPIVQELLEHHAKVNIKDQDGSTALMIAALANQSTTVRKLLDQPDIEVNAQDKDGFTALMWAVRWNRLFIVKQLLTHRANVNIKNQDGATALMLAVKVTLQESNPETVNDMIKIMQELLAYHADANLKNNEGKTALEIAQHAPANKNIQVIIRLLQQAASAAARPVPPLPERLSPEAQKEQEAERISAPYQPQPSVEPKESDQIALLAQEQEEQDFVTLVAQNNQKLAAITQQVATIEVQLGKVSQVPAAASIATLEQRSKELSSLTTTLRRLSEQTEALLNSATTALKAIQAFSPERQHNNRIAPVVNQLLQQQQSLIKIKDQIKADMQKTEQLTAAFKDQILQIRKEQETKQRQREQSKSKQAPTIAPIAAPVQAEPQAKQQKQVVPESAPEQPQRNQAEQERLAREKAQQEAERARKKQDAENLQQISDFSGKIYDLVTTMVTAAQKEIPQLLAQEAWSSTLTACIQNTQQRKDNLNNILEVLTRLSSPQHSQYQENVQTLLHFSEDVLNWLKEKETAFAQLDHEVGTTTALLSHINASPSATTAQTIVDNFQSLSQQAAAKIKSILALVATHENWLKEYCTKLTQYQKNVQQMLAQLLTEIGSKPEFKKSNKVLGRLKNILATIDQNDLQKQSSLKEEIQTWMGENQEFTQMLKTSDSLLFGIFMLFVSDISDISVHVSTYCPKAKESFKQASTVIDSIQGSLKILEERTTSYTKEAHRMLHPE